MTGSEETVDSIVERAMRILERRSLGRNRPKTQSKRTAGVPSAAVQRFLTPGQIAEPEFKRALELDPNCYEALLGLGRCYAYRPTMYAEAVELFDRAAQLRPGLPEPHYRAGLAVLNAGAAGLMSGDPNPFELALNRFEQALDAGFTPRTEMYNLIGTTYFRMGEYSEAIKYFRLSYDSLTDEGGWQPSTFFLAAEAYERLGDLVEAVNWYRLYKQFGHLNDEREIDERINELRSRIDESQSSAPSADRH